MVAVGCDRGSKCRAGILYDAGQDAVVYSSPKDDFPFSGPCRVVLNDGDQVGKQCVDVPVELRFRHHVLEQSGVYADDKSV